MNQLKTHGIILRRTDYGEADRIITFLTPDHGKLRAIAKGVRKQKSKMAGGIELFSLSEIQFIKGRGDIDTLTSTRLQKHFGTIVQDLARTNAGYDILKTVMRVTEDSCGPEYYHLVEESLKALDNASVPLDLVRAWFHMHLLILNGHQPDLAADTGDAPLKAGELYTFDFDNGRFRKSSSGYGTPSDTIKVLRLLSQNKPAVAAKVQGIEKQAGQAAQLLKQMSEYYIQAIQQ